MTQPFRLQRLLDLKAKHEQALAAQLGQAEQQARQERAVHEALEAVRRASVQDMLSAQGERRVGELRPLEALLDHVDQQLDAQATRVADAERTVDAAQAALAAAHREKRVLDRLREKHHDRSRAEEGQADQRRTDDIAMARFLRSRTAD